MAAPCAMRDASASANTIELAAARAHFLHVRLQLLEQVIVRRDRDDRHVLVDQRQRAVLELAGGDRPRRGCRRFP